MFIFNRKKKTVNEANEKALMPSGIVINVQKIFALLHAKAVTAAANLAKVENTAAEGNDPKSAEFHSAGEHMILARNSKDGEQITKAKAFEAIQKYVEVFLGPDIAKQLKEDDCLPMIGGEKEMSESVTFNLSFNQFLTECKFIREADEEDDSDDDNEANDSDNGDDSFDSDSGDDNDDSNSANDADDEDYGDEDDSDDSGSNGGDSDDGDEDDENGSDDSGDDDDNGSDDPDGDGSEEKDPKDVDEADGFYILYGLKIAGLKETTVADAMKKWGSDIVKSFGVRFGNGFGGGMGDIHTIGGGIDNIKDALGRIKDKGALCSKIKDKLSKKFPKVNVADVAFRDKKTLLAELDNPDNRRENYDGKARQKINAADYSLCISIKDDDPSKPFVNRKDLANIVTMSMPGISAQLKNLVKADSIIYLRGSALQSTSDDRSDPDTAFIDIAPDDVERFIKTLKAAHEKSKNKLSAEEIADKKQTIADYNAKISQKEKELSTASDDKAKEIASAIKELKHTRNELQDEIDNNDAADDKIADSVKAMYNKFVQKSKSIDKDKKLKNKDNVQTVMKVWKDTVAAWQKDKNIHNGKYPLSVEKWEEFLAKYKDAYDKNIGKDLKEAYINDIANSLICSLFESTDINNLMNIIEVEDSDDAEEALEDDSDENSDATAEDNNEQNNADENPDDDSDNPYQEQSGDDLYIIPMKGIKFEDEDKGE